MTNGSEPQSEVAIKGTGWVLFAGVMLAIVGIMNTVGGLAALDSSNFYVGDARFIFSDLNTWGWVLLILGIAQIAAALSIWSGGSYGRWIGVASASLNALAQLFFIPAYPLWSLALFSLDILVIYGLIVYGGRRLG
ncbi:MAG: hypothetical protein M9964_12125 [Solirubrobacterales bacterium]|nr:hypothetical protein [Myxococcales bacterium]MCO5327777.1 hypothetical protein [Solirubrobacterales bacterium]